MLDLAGGVAVAVGASLSLYVPLPIAGKIHGRAALHRQRRNAVYLIPMAHTVVVFTPRRLLRISEEISPSNVMVDADFSAA